MVQVPHSSIYLGDLKAEIERRETANVSEFVRESVAMRLEIEDAVEAAGMADELGEEWWRDELYDIVRERAEELREERATDGQEQEQERDELAGEA